MMRALRATLLTVITLGATGGLALAQDTAPVDLEVEAAPGLDGAISTPPDAKRVSKRVAAARSIIDATFAADFSGEIMVDMGGLLMVSAVSPDLAAEGLGAFDKDPIRWPFASVTKQVLAAKMVDELDAVGYSLDTPISQFVDGFDPDEAPVPTMRQLLQHRSGLRNPEETPTGVNTWPEFYNKPDEYGLKWCMEGRSAPATEGWSYNNCDYIVLGAAFDELSFEEWQFLIGRSDLDAKVSRVAITPENAGEFYRLSEGPEAQTIPAYGASAALGGTLEDIIFFNWDRMKKYAQDKEAGGARAAFWQGDPKLGFMALGHWVFEVEHPSCSDPIVVAQRKGAIGRYQLESIMLPELKRSMVFATAKAPFEFGEIWARSGPLFDAVGALACGDKP